MKLLGLFILIPFVTSIRKHLFVFLIVIANLSLAFGSNHPNFDSNDPYEVLGVTAATTDLEIEKAYRKLRSSTHPDRNQNLPRIYFQKVQDAYNQIKQIRSEKNNDAYHDTQELDKELSPEMEKFADKYDLIFEKIFNPTLILQYYEIYMSLKAAIHSYHSREIVQTLKTEDNIKVDELFVQMISELKLNDKSRKMAAEVLTQWPRIAMPMVNIFFKKNSVREEMDLAKIIMQTPEEKGVLSHFMNRWWSIRMVEDEHIFFRSLAKKEPDRMGPSLIYFLTRRVSNKKNAEILSYFLECCSIRASLLLAAISESTPYLFRHRNLLKNILDKVSDSELNSEEFFNLYFFLDLDDVRFVTLSIIQDQLKKAQLEITDQIQLDKTVDLGNRKSNLESAWLKMNNTMTKLAHHDISISEKENSELLSVMDFANQSEGILKMALSLHERLDQIRVIEQLLLSKWPESASYSQDQIGSNASTVKCVNLFR